MDQEIAQISIRVGHLVRSDLSTISVIVAINNATIKKFSSILIINRQALFSYMHTTNHQDSPVSDIVISTYTHTDTQEEHLISGWTSLSHLQTILNPPKSHSSI